MPRRTSENDPKPDIVASRDPHCVGDGLFPKVRDIRSQGLSYVILVAARLFLVR
jgi:hypothetical protein